MGPDGQPATRICSSGGGGPPPCCAAGGEGAQREPGGVAAAGATGRRRNSRLARPAGSRPPAARAWPPQAAARLLGGLHRRRPCRASFRCSPQALRHPSAPGRMAALAVGGLATAAGTIGLVPLAGAAGPWRLHWGGLVGWGIQFQVRSSSRPRRRRRALLPRPVGPSSRSGCPRSGAPRRSRCARRLLGHFVDGLFATLMATPCSAPFLGTAIGFGPSQSASVILAVFTALGSASRLPTCRGGGPGSVARLPRPRASMVRSGVVHGLPPRRRRRVALLRPLLAGGAGARRNDRGRAPRPLALHLARRRVANGVRCEASVAAALAAFARTPSPRRGGDPLESRRAAAAAGGGIAWTISTREGQGPRPRRPARLRGRHRRLVFTSRPTSAGHRHAQGRQASGGTRSYQ